MEYLQVGVSYLEMELLMLSLIILLLLKCHILRQRTQQDPYACLCRES